MASAHEAPPLRKAWVTLITNTDYLPGLLVLNHSLLRTGTRYPLVALYTDALSLDAHRVLDRRAIPKRRVQALSPRISRSYGDDPRFADVWTKLSIYELVEFDRVVLLDSDMLVRRNMDELMDLPLDGPDMKGRGKRALAACHACVCNPLKKLHYPPDWIPTNCAFYKQHGEPDRAQLEGGLNTDSLGLLNSGLVVIRPCVEALEQIQEQLQKDEVSRYIFPDQDLLADVYRGRWVPLPYVYNALKPMRRKGVHENIWRDDVVKNVHFILGPKPWNELPKDADAANKWWHDANAERLSEEQRLGVYDGTGEPRILGA
ncbi:MAG: hypothetical protein Q9159_006697 [Coniocarpon cinnabarinum]